MWQSTETVDQDQGDITKLPGPRPSLYPQTNQQPEIKIRPLFLSLEFPPDFICEKLVGDFYHSCYSTLMILTGAQDYLKSLITCTCIHSCNVMNIQTWSGLLHTRISVVL